MKHILTAALVFATCIGLLAIADASFARQDLVQQEDR